MHVAFALFADAANVSQEGKLNILGVFDALHVGTAPAIHPRAHLVVHIKGTSGDIGTHTVTLRWLSPRGTELWSSAGDLNVGPLPTGVTEMDVPLIAQIDLPIEGAGSYAMAIALDDEPTTQVPIQVRVGAPPIAAPSGLVS